MFDKTTTFQSQEIKIQLGLRPKFNIYDQKRLKFCEYSFRTAEKITGKMAMAKISASEFQTLRVISKQQLPELHTEMHQADILIGMDHFWGLVTNVKHAQWDEVG